MAEPSDISNIAEPAPLIRITDLHKSYQSGSGATIRIFTGTDLEVNRGETMAVVGASGIGKSTLLHILGTLDHPDQGKMVFDGADVFSMADDRLAAFRNTSIGFVFQFHHLLPEFDALENTMMPLLINRQPRHDARRVAEQMLIRVGLKERLLHRVGNLSGGEQQRVALARALVLKPHVLLADEPTGNLDQKSSGQVHDMLMELNREMGMTLIVVTHNLELASLMDRRVTISEGRLIESP